MEFEGIRLPLFSCSIISFAIRRISLPKNTRKIHLCLHISQKIGKPSKKEHSVSCPLLCHIDKTLLYYPNRQPFDFSLLTFSYKCMFCSHIKQDIPSLQVQLPMYGTGLSSSSLFLTLSRNQPQFN